MDLISIIAYNWKVSVDDVKIISCEFDNTSTHAVFEIETHQGNAQDSVQFKDSLWQNACTIH